MNKRLNENGTSENTPDSGVIGAKSPRDDTPKDGRRKAGGQPGNRNKLRHGLRGGKVPKGAEYVEGVVNELRRVVEDTVLAAKGEISLLDACAINSVLKWERHGLLAQFWLRKEAETLSASDRLRFSEAVAKASDNRDRNIRALGLDRDDADNVITALYSPAAKENDSE